MFATRYGKLLNSKHSANKTMRKLKHHQRGISLYIIIILVLLSTLLALWASRTALFNELIVGNDADYQRAFEAAQTIMEDAKNDIRLQNIPAATYPLKTNNKPRFPTEATGAFDELVDLLEAESAKCLHGICAKRTGAQNFWIKPSDFTSMTGTGVAARYGEYTGAAAGGTSNAILANTTAGQGAWYWVEVMRYAPSGANVTSIEPTKSPLIFRITAIARGLKPNTQVVLQSTIAFQAIKGE